MYVENSVKLLKINFSFLRFEISHFTVFKIEIEKGEIFRFSVLEHHQLSYLRPQSDGLARSSRFRWTGCRSIFENYEINRVDFLLLLP